MGPRPPPLIASRPPYPVLPLRHTNRSHPCLRLATLSPRRWQRIPTLCPSPGCPFRAQPSHRSSPRNSTLSPVGTSYLTDTNLGRGPLSALSPLSRRNRATHTVPCPPSMVALPSISRHLLLTCSPISRMASSPVLRYPRASNPHRAIWASSLLRCCRDHLTWGTRQYPLLLSQPPLHLRPTCPTQGSKLPLDFPNTCCPNSRKCQWLLVLNRCLPTLTCTLQVVQERQCPPLVRGCPWSHRTTPPRPTSTFPPPSTLRYLQPHSLIWSPVLSPTCKGPLCRCLPVSYPPNSTLTQTCPHSPCGCPPKLRAHILLLSAIRGLPSSPSSLWCLSLQPHILQPCTPQLSQLVPHSRPPSWGRTFLPLNTFCSRLLVRLQAPSLLLPPLPLLPRPPLARPL